MGKETGMQAQILSRRRASQSYFPAMWFGTMARSMSSESSQAGSSTRPEKMLMLTFGWDSM